MVVVVVVVGMGEEVQGGEKAPLPPCVGERRRAPSARAASLLLVLAACAAAARAKASTLSGHLGRKALSEAPLCSYCLQQPPPPPQKFKRVLNRGGGLASV